MKVKDTFAFWLIGIGAFCFISLLLLFLFKDDVGIHFAYPIDSEKFSRLGSILSGLVGTFWSLASVILFYVALTEQRKDIETNRKALEIQTQAFQEQMKEFELQTKELEESRKIFLEQSNTQALQRFESTFFQMLNLNNSIVNAMSVRDTRGNPVGSGVEGFQVISVYLDRDWNKIKNLSESDIVLSYLDLYEQYQHILGHYFRNLYHLYKFVDKATIIDQKFYSSLIRAQLSTFELVLLFYNGLSVNGRDKFKPLIERYEIFKNLDWRLLNGGKDTIKRYSHAAFGQRNFKFLDKVDDWL